MRISDWSSDVCSSDLILHIVAAQKPQNEAQAALAAQTAATHILTMKVAKRVADYPHDTRMIAAYAQLARASATPFEPMAVLHGTSEAHPVGKEGGSTCSSRVSPHP